MKAPTAEQKRDWQAYVSQQIRRQRSQGVSQETAVERALDLRDTRIAEKKTPPKFGKK